MVIEELDTFRKLSTMIVCTRAYMTAKMVSGKMAFHLRAVPIAVVSCCCGSFRCRGEVKREARATSAVEMGTGVVPLHAGGREGGREIISIHYPSMQMYIEQRLNRK